MKMNANEMDHNNHDHRHQNEIDELAFLVAASLAIDDETSNDDDDEIDQNKSKDIVPAAGNNDSGNDRLQKRLRGEKRLGDILNENPRLEAAFVNLLKAIQESASAPPAQVQNRRKLTQFYANPLTLTGVSRLRKYTRKYRTEQGNRDSAASPGDTGRGEKTLKASTVAPSHPKPQKKDYIIYNVKTIKNMKMQGKSGIRYYSGSVLGRRPHGSGMLKFPNGDVVYGHWYVHNTCCSNNPGDFSCRCTF